MSLPSRERGLKFGAGVPVVCLVNVAPFAGAWIEMVLSNPVQLCTMVAPFAGAWIEIHLRRVRLQAEKVAPFAGAWIEIARSSSRCLGSPCRSLRGSVD